MRPTTLFVMDPAVYDLVYALPERAAISELTEVLGAPVPPKEWEQHRDRLARAESIFTSWGMPVLDEKLLAAAPKLKAVFYGAGSIRNIVTDAFWQRGIAISSAYAANAIPVAEYSLGVILLSLKHFFRHAVAAKTQNPNSRSLPVPGAYRSTIGIISLGMIGRRVCELLRPHDVRVLAYDPFTTPAQAAALNVQLGSLEEIFRQADAVSLHTPWLKETEGMITGAHFAAMKPGATFINSARGAVVREAEMSAELQRRPDLTAVLDVTFPEPPVAGSPLYALPNVVLTPHIAGSMDNECHRMGAYMVAELRRYLAGQPLQWQISKELAAKLA